MFRVRLMDPQWLAILRWLASQTRETATTLGGRGLRAFRCWGEWSRRIRGLVRMRSGLRSNLRRAEVGWGILQRTELWFEARSMPRSRARWRRDRGISA